jgi:hypothetical protein
MHINSHFTPPGFGASSRPDHAANPAGRPQQTEQSPYGVEATTTTDTAAAVAATEETEIPGRSVAHQARGHLNTLQGLGGQNLGWLVSQIAQGTFDASVYGPIDEGSEGDGSESAAASIEETGEGETAATSSETTAASEEDTTASTDESTDAVAGLVDDLVDELLEDGEEDGAGGSEVT